MPSRLLARRRRRGRRHEEHDEQERDDVCRRVDDEHVRGANEADQHAADRRPEQHRRADRALEERVRLADRLLVLAEQLRNDHPLRGEVRRPEDAEQEREHERAPPARGARSSGARARGASAARAARRRSSIERRAPSRWTTSRPEGSPATVSPTSSAIITSVICAGESVVTSTNHGQREPRHLRAGRRDHLGGEQRAQRAVAEESPRGSQPSSCSRWWVPAIGDASSHTTESTAPMDAASNIGRRPMAPARRPPSSAPNGRVP